MATEPEVFWTYRFASVASCEDADRSDILEYALEPTTQLWRTAEAAMRAAESWFANDYADSYDDEFPMPTPDWVHCPTRTDPVGDYRWDAVTDRVPGDFSIIVFPSTVVG